MTPRVLLSLLLWLTCAASTLAGPVPYDIAYVRAPRAGDDTFVRLPDVFHPTAMPAGLTSTM